MTDLLLVFGESGPDVQLHGGDVVLDHGFRTSGLLSLFTDARGLPEDGQVRGFWGDEEGQRLGSRLWTLDRAAITPATLELAKGMAAQAIGWLVSEGAADSVTVATSRRGRDGIHFQIQIVASDQRRWQSGWDAESGESGESIGPDSVSIFVP